MLGRSNSLRIRLNRARVKRNTSATCSRVATSVLNIPLRTMRIISYRSASIAPFKANTCTSHRACATKFSVHRATLLLGRHVLGCTRRLAEVPRCGLSVVSKRVIHVASGHILVSLKSLSARTLCDLSRDRRLSTRDATRVGSGTCSFKYAFTRIRISVPVYGMGLLSLIGMRSTKALVGPTLTRTRMRNNVDVKVKFKLSRGLLFSPGAKETLGSGLLSCGLSAFVSRPELHTCFMRGTRPADTFKAGSLNRPPAYSVTPTVHGTICRTANICMGSTPIGPRRLFHDVGRRRVFRRKKRTGM